MNAKSARSLNPATGEPIQDYPFETAADVDTCLAHAHAAHQPWAAQPVATRTAVLLRMAAALRGHLEELARLATREMGKPIAQARAEVEKCAALCEWYAGHGPAMLQDEATPVGPEAVVAWQPLGCVLAVMPWNFPFWQVMRGAVPILLGGNAYVLKHAPNVMGCAYALHWLWREAGLPEGVFSVLNVTPELVSRAIADRRIAAVAVTGSVRAGQAIAAQAGAALKKTVMELGGADPFIVLADADLDAAVAAAVLSRFQNAGQVCIAAKRIILEAPIAEAFTERLVAAVAALQVGDPLDVATQVGPMARYDLRDELHTQVQAAVAEGARLLLGGAPLAGPGNYYAPTVLADAGPGNTAFVDELFGPVAALCVARDAEHALTLANDSAYGLSAALWSANAPRAQALARRIESGGVFINGHSVSDPRVPIGGIKHSGYGRELSHWGVREFMNAQSVWQCRPAAPV